MLKYVLSVVTLVLSHTIMAGEIAFTFDDAPTYDSAVMSGAERTSKLINGLTKNGVDDAVIFVLAKNITEESVKRLTQYVDAGFELGNHTFTHESANKLEADNFLLDSYHAYLKIKRLDPNTRYFRFPYLHYGESQEKRKTILDGLHDMGYQIGYVTVDNYDWYINSLYVKAVEDGHKVNLENLGKLYVDVIWASIQFYDQIAIKYIGKSPKHILLLHENDMAAMFLPQLIKKIRKSGWETISPTEAYSDQTLRSSGDNYEFFKQGRIAAIAQTMGANPEQLRTPYESIESIDKLFLEYNVVQ